MGGKFKFILHGSNLEKTAKESYKSKSEIKNICHSRRILRGD